jgi:hypothetical protein
MISEHGKKKTMLVEEKILKQMSQTGTKVPKLEAQHELDEMTAADYDKWFVQAVRERKEERVQRGYGIVQHPTTRLFEIGIDSILEGTPSRQFLRLLKKIADKAEDKDVMALLFPKSFPRRIKKVTIRAAQRDVIIVERFKAHIKKYLTSPRNVLSNGKEGIDAEWKWDKATYAEAMASHKLTLSLHEQKALDRALQTQGQDLLEYRDWIAELRGNANKS